jgi:hypothetical protein
MAVNNRAFFIFLLVTTFCFELIHGQTKSTQTTLTSKSMTTSKIFTSTKSQQTSTFSRQSMSSTTPRSQTTKTSRKNVATKISSMNIFLTFFIFYYINIHLIFNHD